MQTWIVNWDLVWVKNQMGGGSAELFKHFVLGPCGVSKVTNFGLLYNPSPFFSIFPLQKANKAFWRYYSKITSVFCMQPWIGI